MPTDLQLPAMFVEQPEDDLQSSPARSQADLVGTLQSSRVTVPHSESEPPGFA
jgi:hypothetical protein